MYILLVEDDEWLGAALRRMLQKRGHSVHRVTTIQDAVTWSDIYLSFPTMAANFVVVSDRELPDGNGWEWVKNNTAEWDARGIRYVRMSGNPPKDCNHPYYHKGVDNIDRLFMLIEEKR